MYFSLLISLANLFEALYGSFRPPSIINRDGLGFVSDGLIGDDPESVKATIRERATALLDLDFDHLLFAHGEPVIGGGKEALRAFAAAE